MFCIGVQGLRKTLHYQSWVLSRRFRSNGLPSGILFLVWSRCAVVRASNDQSVLTWANRDHSHCTTTHDEFCEDLDRPRCYSPEQTGNTACGLCRTRETVESRCFRTRIRSVGTADSDESHLYSLFALWRKQHGSGGHSVPELFEDQGYQTLNHVVLSTSNCGNPSLRIFGFGPVVQDGFGIGYIIRDHKLTICASSKHLQTKRFLSGIEQYLYAIQRTIIEYVSKWSNAARSKQPTSIKSKLISI